jgi:hypothetical protein
MNDSRKLSSPLRDAPAEGAIHTRKEGGKERSTSPFAKLGALLDLGARDGGSFEGNGVGGGWERGGGRKAPARFLRLRHEGSATSAGRKHVVAVERVLKEGARGRRAASWAGTPEVQLRKTGGNGRKALTTGIDRSLESGGASTPGHTPESLSNKNGTKAALSKVGSKEGMSPRIKDTPLSVERGLLSENSSCSSTISREMVGQDAEIGERSDEMKPDLHTRRAAEDGLSGPSDDWFDLELSSTTNDSETPAESTSAQNVAQLQAAVKAIDIQADREATALRRQVSAARQTADVSRRQAPKVATSRILEASDYMDASSGDLFPWDDNDDVARAVPIYRKQRGDGEGRARSGGGARAPRKRERHKAKTHEDHRRRAHERKSQLASAGLPLHLEAEGEEKEHVLDVVSLAVEAFLAVLLCTHNVPYACMICLYIRSAIITGSRPVVGNPSTVDWRELWFCGLLARRQLVGGFCFLAWGWNQGFVQECHDLVGCLSRSW